MQLLLLVRTLVSYFLFALLLAIFFVPAIIFLVLPKEWCYENRLFYWLFDLFYRLTLKCILIPITFEGIDNIPKNAAIFIANHQSALDAPLLGRLSNGKPHVWIAMQELETWPLVNFFLSRLAILVDRSSPIKAMRGLLKAVNMVYGKRRNMIIFPEGQRYTDGKVHDFYAGFVILAKKTKRPVVPVRIFGAYKVFPPGSFYIHKHSIKVVVGKPFIYQENDTDDSFKQRVYQWFLDQGEG